MQCINLACMSRALRSDNMENYFRSIRKLHLAPVQGLRRQVWTKQCILLLILDYRARQQSDDLSHRCWYSLLLTGLAAFSSDSADAWSQVWCSLLQLSRGSVMEDLRCFGHRRLQMRLCVCARCVLDPGFMHTWVGFASWKEMRGAWMHVFTCVCAGVVQLFGDWLPFTVMVFFHWL